MQASFTKAEVSLDPTDEDLSIIASAFGDNLLRAIQDCDTARDT